MSSNFEEVFVVKGSTQINVIPLFRRPANHNVSHFLMTNKVHGTNLLLLVFSVCRGSKVNMLKFLVTTLRKPCDLAIRKTVLRLPRETLPKFGRRQVYGCRKADVQFIFAQSRRHNCA